MAERLKIKYNTLRQSQHDLPTFPYDPQTFNFGWDLIIHDRDYIGQPVALNNITDSGVVIKHEGARADMNQPIVPTVVEFTLLIDNQSTQDFIDDISLSDEERFYVEVKHKETTKFIGYILLDQVTEDITEGPRLLTIKAVDGLSRMKEVKYPVEDFNGTYPSLSSFDEFTQPTFTEIIVRCFEETNITPLYAADFPLFNIYIAWTEAQMATNDAANPSTFDKVRCQQKLFYNLDEAFTGFSTEYKDRSKAMSCYKVLEIILTVFHAKIFYDEGRYYIRHAWGSESSDRVMTWHHYTKNGTPINSSTMDRSQDLGYLFADDLRMIKPSSIEYVAPYKYIELNFQGLSETPINGYVWEGDDFTWQVVNYFLEGESVRLNLNFIHEQVQNGQPLVSIGGGWTFRMQVRVGTWYLKRYVNNNALWSVEWVEDSSVFIEYQAQQNAWNFDQDYYKSKIEYSVDSAPIDAPMEVRLLLVYYTSGQTAAIEYIKGYLDNNPFVSTVAADFVGTRHSMEAGLITQNLGNDEDETTIYRSGSIAGNSRSKSIKTLIGNVQDDVYVMEQLKMKVDGGGWKPLTTFDTVNWGNGHIIQTKLVESYARTHTIPKKILNMVLDDVKNRVTFNTVLVYEGFDYMPISMDYTTSLDRYRGQWVQIGKTDQTVTVDIFFQPTKNKSNLSGFGAPTPDQLAGLIGDSSIANVGVLEKSRSYVSASNNLTILDHTIPADIKTAYTRKSIDDSYILYVNGVRWRYVPTLAEVNKAGLFTLTGGTINWTIWRSIDAEVRLEVWDRLVVEVNPIS